MSLELARNNLLSNFENCKLYKYQDTNGLWTIGKGHLITKNDNFSDTITQSEADQLFDKDISIADQALTLPTLTSSHMRSALISFVFNVGQGAFKRSKMFIYLQGMMPSRAFFQFDEWIHNNDGTVNRGLAKRRTIEKHLFKTLQEFDSSLIPNGAEIDDLIPEMTNIITQYYRDYNA